MVANDFVLVSISLLMLTACGESQSCTLIAGVPSVSIDTAALSIDSPELVEVCLDDRCVPLLEVEVASLGVGEALTVISVEGDDSTRSIVVRSLDGQVLAGPAVVEIPVFYPNGEGCGGEALQGRFAVQADGSID